MFIALTKEKKRVSIENAQPNEIYLCPVCGNPVVVKAACSNNVRTHFAHKRNSLCLDNWKHDMSDWHLGWQSKFPIENREVVVENNGVVHRADVLINNTVIEFQHSPISGEEFEARNNFYKNCGFKVVWLFDVTGKMRIGDLFNELEWKRKTTLFSSMKSPVDAFYIQHYLPESEDRIILVEKPGPKRVFYNRTTVPICPDNFLKEYGAIQNKDVLSIYDIFEKTKADNRAYQRKKRELEEQLLRAKTNALFDFLSRGRNKRRGHL